MLRFKSALPFHNCKILGKSFHLSLHLLVHTLGMLLVLHKVVCKLHGITNVRHEEGVGAQLLYGHVLVDGECYKHICFRCGFEESWDFFEMTIFQKKWVFFLYMIFILLYLPLFIGYWILQPSLWVIYTKCLRPTCEDFRQQYLPHGQWIRQMWLPLPINEGAPSRVHLLFMVSLGILHASLKRICPHREWSPSSLFQWQIQVNLPVVYQTTFLYLYMGPYFSRTFLFFFF